MRQFFLVFLLAAVVGTLFGQQAPPDAANLQQLQQQLREVVSTLQQTRDELHTSQQEIEKLRSEVASLHAAPAPSPTAAPQAVGDQELATLEQNQQLLAARVDQQYQTKVESGSKYRVRLSGLVLFNASSTRGAVDEQDVPMLAATHAPGTSGGNISATMRQTLVNIDVTGPEFAGARTSAQVQLDFFGGFPYTLDGVAMGIARMRVAHAQLDWENWSLTIGQDKPFIAPNTPTSLAAIGTPEFGYSGNLWSWTPQIVAERRWQPTDNLVTKFQAGMMDPLSGEYNSDVFGRYPDSGERSRTPAFAARQSVQYGSGIEASTLGVGGYFARHDYNFGRLVDSWAATLDWDFSLSPKFKASGALYRGQALGGLWGGIGTSVVFDGSPSNAVTRAFPINTIGGWSQLKFKPAPKWEFNGAFGEDSPFASELRQYAGSPTYAPYLRNWTTMFNVIERPRSNLMLSLEYRHLNSVNFMGKRETAEHLNLGVGVSF